MGYGWERTVQSTQYVSTRRGWRVGEMLRHALSIESGAVVALTAKSPWIRERFRTGSGLSSGRLPAVCSHNRQSGQLPRVRQIRRSRLVTWWIGSIATLVARAAGSSSDASAGSC